MATKKDKVRAEAQARFEQLYRQLNPQQRAAVDTTEGTMLVLAGPGTGKTQLLAMRIANILRQTQMDPWNILCVTFTESGVTAMRQRLLQIIGTPAYYVRIHTFHSFCNEIIQEHPEYFAPTRSWQPLSDIERLQLVESLIDELRGTSPLKPFGEPYLYLRDIVGHIQSLKQEALSPEAFSAVLDGLQEFVGTAQKHVEKLRALKPRERTEARCRATHAALHEAAIAAKLAPSVVAALDRFYQRLEQQSAGVDAKAASKLRTAYKNSVTRWFDRLNRQLPKQQELARLYARYQVELRARGRYDFEDMINLVIEAFGEHDELLATYQEQFQYIMVDEYQDTNGAQNEVVRLLGSFDERPNICVVGDDKQSIYRFQGASLNNMLDFYKRYADHVAVVSLQENYRSQATVLTAAQAVIEHNTESITKYIPGTTQALTATVDLPPQVLREVVVDSEDAEDYLIAQRIKDLIGQGVAPHEIAVLVRYHRDSTELYHKLQRLQVPVRLEAGENALHDIQVQQLLALLSYLHDEQREELLAQLLHFEWLSFDSLDVLKVIHQAGKQRRPLLELLVDAESLRAAGVREVARFEQLAVQLAQWRQYFYTHTLYAAVHRIIRESGLLDFILGSPERVAILSKVTALLDELERMNRQQLALSLQDFLAALTTLQEHEVGLTSQPWQLADEAVRIMTAHKAKGLEFSHVFIPRMVDKHWGNNPVPEKLSLPHGLVRYDFVMAQENNEDERRLFYVALTRAKQGIVMTRARRNTQGRETVPSLFLQELPAELLVQEDVHEEPEAAQERLVRGRLTPVPEHSAGDIRAWLTEQLQGYVLSVTHLSAYLRCPQEFYQRALLRVPTVRSKYQALGSAIHEALAAFLQQHREQGRVPSKRRLLAVFRQYVAREVLTETERRDVLTVGEEILGNYYDHYRASFSKEALGEYNFASHGVHLDGIPLTGLVDKIEIVDATRKLVNVVDYKTGQPDGKSAALKVGGEYHRQLVFYKLLCDLSPRFPYTMVSGEINFIQQNRRGQFVKKRIAIDDADTSALAADIKRVWQEVMALRFMEPVARCGDCQYCVAV